MNPGRETERSGEFPPATRAADAAERAIRDTLGAALRFKGHGVNSRNPAEVQEAGKLLLAAKKDPNCVGFDGSVGAAKKVISGQADFASAAAFFAEPTPIAEPWSAGFTNTG